MDIKKAGFALVAIAAAILVAGCIDSSPAPTVTSEPTPEQTFGRSTQIPQPERNDNAIFIRLVEEMSYDISKHLKELGACVSDGNYMDAYIAAVRLESLADVYLGDINGCVVTDDKQKVQALVVASLVEVKLGAIDCQVGLPKTGTNVDRARLLKGLGHFEIAVEYLEEIERV